MPRTLVARVLSQQARNSLFPAPPIQTTPPADREAGLAAGHSLTVALSCPVLPCPDGRQMEGFDGWTG